MSEIKIRNMLVTGDHTEKTVTIHDEQYKIRAISPTEERHIALMRVRLAGNMPASSFTADELYPFERAATVQNQVIESPEWFNVDTCLDVGVLDTLFSEIVQLTNNFQEALKKNKLAKRG